MKKLFLTGVELVLPSSTFSFAGDFRSLLSRRFVYSSQIMAEFGQKIVYQFEGGTLRPNH